MDSGNSGEQWYYVARDGSTAGPLSLAALSAAVLSGDVSSDTAVWTEAFGTQWRAALRIDALRPAWTRVERDRVRAVTQSPLSVRPPLQALAEALAAVRSALFSPFSFLAWLSIAFCNLMASTRLLYGVDGAQGAMAAQPASYSRLFAALRDGVVRLFDPSLSWAWLLTILLYGALNAYIGTKGRLLFVGKAFFPAEPVALLWRRGTGRTASLWRLYFSLDAILNIGFYALIYRFLATSGLATGDTSRAALTAALHGPAAGWAAAAMALALAVEFLRSASFHFIDPVVFMFGIPASSAAKMVLKTIPANAARFLGFFAVVVFCRLAYAALVLAGLLLLPLPILAPLGLVLLLPFDFLVRVIGTRFIAVQAAQQPRGDAQ